ncbi:hypothetical protein [Streptomyces anulatus]|uniref:hypothetical protein n=1 Tax=Streptomyces anulatus TaxID=1892 RepID=UPI00342ED323
MANDRLTEAYRCGQLFAALAALERLSEGPHHSLGKPGVRRQLSTEPRKHLTVHLWQAGRYLAGATNRDQGPAASVIFRQLPDLLPRRRELPGEIRDPAERARFQEGVQAQEAAIEKALAEL